MPKTEGESKKRRYNKVPIVIMDLQTKTNPAMDHKGVGEEIRKKLPDLVGWSYSLGSRELIIDFGEAENPDIDLAAIGTVKEVG